MKKKLLAVLLTLCLAVTGLFGLVACKKNDDGPLNLVIANNDSMAIGAIEALVDAGWNKGNTNADWKTKSIPVFGVDAIADAEKYLKEDQMTGTVGQDAAKMAKAMATMVQSIDANINALADTWLEGSEFSYKQGRTHVVEIPYFKYEKNGQATTTATYDISKKVKFYQYNTDAYPDAVVKEFKTLVPSNVTYANSNNDGAGQLSAIRTDITGGEYDIYVINLVNNGQGEEVMKLCKDANKPVVFWNKEVGVIEIKEKDGEPTIDNSAADTVLNSYNKSAYVGADAKQSGTYQGELIADSLMNETSPFKVAKTTTVNYAVLKGDTGGHQDEILRTYWAVTTANKLLTDAGYKELKRISSEYGEWDTAKAKSIIKTLITANGVEVAK